MFISLVLYFHYLFISYFKSLKVLLGLLTNFHNHQLKIDNLIS
jgi:hypothetical protein